MTDVLSFETFQDFKRKVWGNGPWVDEPDALAWCDLATRLECKATRHPEIGHWCGYVQISGFSRVALQADKARMILRVHGGVTWNDTIDDEGHFIGFDCGHCWDYPPGMAAQFPSGLFGNTKSYRDLNYVILECRDLAQSVRLFNLPKNRRKKRGQYAKVG